MSLLSPIADAREARWARRAAAGDRRAFDRMYARLYPAVMAYVHRRIHTRADAEDLGARVFVRIVERLADFRADRGTVRAWALTIARNLVIDHLRTRRAIVDVDDAPGVLADSALAPDDALIEDETLAALRESIASLPEVDRELFSLRYGDGLRLAEIATITAMTEDAVKQRFSRALRKLRAAHGPTARRQPEASGYAL
jgi:RNA polymerase sigma-70 factor (ECF subfamily)